MDALISDAVFPIAKKEIFLCKGLEAPPFERVGPQVCYSPYRCSQAEIQLKLLARLAFQAPDPLGLRRSELALKSFDLDSSRCR